MEFRAVLSKVKNKNQKYHNESLEIYVFKEHLSIQPKEGFEFTHYMGDIKFPSNLGAEDIINNFSDIYVGGMTEGGEICASVKYKLEFEPTITMAFVNYFSDLAKNKSIP